MQSPWRFATPGSSGDSFRFPRIANIRSVFWVLKENASLTSVSFLLGGDNSIDFHRGGLNGPLWTSNGNPFITGGTTKLMGAVVDGTKTALPAASYQLVSLVTTGNVRANTVTEDRGPHDHGSWQGDIAEILIYTRELTKLAAPCAAKTISYLSGKDWDGQSGSLIRSANGIAALTWANVPLDQ